LHLIESRDVAGEGSIEQDFSCKEVIVLFLRAQEEVVFSRGDEERRMAEGWVECRGRVDDRAKVVVV